MALAMNAQAAHKSASTYAKGAGILATIGSFVSMFGYAVQAARAVNIGRRPANDVLIGLGINPKDFPRNFPRAS